MSFGVSFLIGVIIGILLFYHRKEKKERLKAKEEGDAARAEAEYRSLVNEYGNPHSRSFDKGRFK